MCCFAQQHQFFLNAPSQSMKFSECNCASLLHQKLSFKIWSKCCNGLFKILHQFLCFDLRFIQVRTRCLTIEGTSVTQSHCQVSLVVKFCRTVYICLWSRKRGRNRPVYDQNQLEIALTGFQLHFMATLCSITAPLSAKQPSSLQRQKKSWIQAFSLKFIQLLYLQLNTLTVRRNPKMGWLSN